MTDDLRMSRWLGSWYWSSLIKFSAILWLPYRLIDQTLCSEWV